IDEINILNASILAMQKAVELLEVQADFLLIDGHRFKPYQNIPHSCEIKGDGRFSSIAAASVLAKTHRDDYMQKIHLDYPVYSWNKNKGYPTKEHRAGIQKFGITDHHRKSFRLLDEQLEISF
ncbi:MAG: ribonuclease HII, partial [Bacteroidetes bacterium]|nr:ribonuclease HII [Bacteroidota bacterium]